MALSIGELVGYIDLDTSGAEGAVDRVGGLLSGKGGKWGAILGGLGAAGGVMFGASLVGAVDKEVGSDRLAASLGKGNKAAEAYGRVAGEVFSNGFGAGLDDVNTAIGAVVTSIKGMRGASDTEVQAMTEKAMTLADVMQVDVTRAAQVAGNMVYNGMAKDGTEAFDLLMKAMQKVPVQLREDVMDATDEYGQFFSQLGIDGPAAMGMLAAGAEKGMYGIDKAGDAIKEFTIKATDMSQGTKDAYKAIGLGAKDMTADLLAGGDRGSKAFDKIVAGLLGIEDPVKRSQAALGLFGTPLEDLGTKDIPTFLRSLRNGEDSLGKFKGAVDDAGQTAYDNASTNLTSFKRSLQTGFVDMIGGKVLPKVTEWSGALNNDLGPAVSAVGDAVQKVTGWLQDHSTAAKALVGVVVGLAVVTAAHAAVLAVGAAGGMAAWLRGTKLISGATKVWAAVQWAMNTALLANPIGLAVVAIAALVGAVIYVATKTEWGRKMVSKAMDGIRSAAQAVGSFFTQKVPQFFQTAWTKAKDWTQDAIDKIAAWVGGIPGKFSSKLSSLASTVRGLFRDAMQAGKDRVTSIAGSILDYVKGTPGRFTNNLSNLTGTVRNLFRDAMDAGKERVTGIGATIVGWIAGIPGKLLNKLGAFSSAGRQLLQGFVDGMKNAAGVIEGIAGNVWNAVRGLLNGAIAKINAALEFTINLPGPKDLTVNAPNIPMLATGGRATAATLAVIGEGREPESVLPDSVLRGLLERAHMAGAAMAGGNAGRGYNGPLIGKVVQQPGMSTDDLAERLWFKTRTRG